MYTCLLAGSVESCRNSSCSFAGSEAQCVPTLSGPVCRCRVNTDLNVFNSTTRRCQGESVSRGKASKFRRCLFLKVLEDISPFLFVGPLISLFWTSGDVSSGFQIHSGQPYSHLAEAYVIYVPRDSPLV